MRLIINKLQGRFVTRVTKITFFVPNSVTKTKSRTSLIVIGDLFFGLKEKKWRFRGLRKTVAIRWFFHSRKHAYFILKHSKFTRFFLPSRASISPSISSSEDRCLVWLVYLIHEPDRTSNWSFFFNQNTSLHSIVRFRKELTLSRGSLKTMRLFFPFTALRLSGLKGSWYRQLLATRHANYRPYQARLAEWYHLPSVLQDAFR